MRTIEELMSYAERLHTVDPQCREPVPVTTEEFSLIRHEAIKRSTKAAFMKQRNIEVKLCGHRLKIMNEGRGR